MPKPTSAKTVVKKKKVKKKKKVAKKTKPTGFAAIDLSKVMMKSLEDAGYSEPTPIQAGLIPLALDSIDVLGQARTGTGKTAAFAIPIIELLRPRKETTKVQAIILVPTRELAVQVREELIKLASGQKVACVALYGGKPIRGQIDKLKQKPQVVVGTPGRVLDHIGRGTLDLQDVDCVVLDEADRMLDIGFRPDIEKILRRCPEDRQTLLLSATVPPAIERLARRYMYEPKTLDFSPGDISVDTIEQFYFTVDGRRKFDLLLQLLEREKPTQTIVFCRTKKGTDRVGERLKKKYPKVGCIHGDMQQGARDRVMEQFRNQKISMLVATDVVGRGIDVSTLSHIVNYDIPHFCDDYVHRVGRTGRMGRDGVAYTFVTPEEGGELTRIEMRIDKLLTRGDLPGFEPVALKPEEEQKPAEPTKPVPSELKRGGRGKKKHRRAL